MDEFELRLEKISGRGVQERIKKRVSDNTLFYFRCELSQPLLGMKYAVFPKADDSDEDVFKAQVLFNRLIVKVFLAHNWKPFVHVFPDGLVPLDFVYVIVDAHIMHTIKFP